MVAIKVRFDGKTFVPERIVADVPQGAEAVVHYEPTTAVAPPSVPDTEPISALEWAANNVIDDANLPADLSYQHDHYLYGTPKKPTP
jgi:hypothetical protein